MSARIRTTSWPTANTARWPVAVVVPSPATSDVFDATSFTICAPMFSNLSSSSTSFATVTPSLVTFGAPKDFSSTTLRPRGPRVTVTASARMLTPRRIFSRASWLNFTSFAAMAYVPPSTFEHAEDVLLAHDEMLFAVELHLGPGVLPEQDGVADLDVERRHLPVVVHLALADGHDFALLGLLLRRVGDDDAALRLLHLIFEALDEDAILKGPDLHADRSFPLGLYVFENRYNLGVRGPRVAPGYSDCATLTNHHARSVKIGGGSASELPALLLVVPSIEDVPLAASGDDPLRHPGAGQLVEPTVEREPVGERTLRLGEEQALVADPPELLGPDRLQERVREERQAGLGERHSGKPFVFAIRCFTSCSTRRRSRSSRRTPGAPWRTTRSASACASRSISASSSKFRARIASKRARTVSSGASSSSTCAWTRRFTRLSATRAICAGDGRIPTT